jgi:hypothetical protein
VVVVGPGSFLLLEPALRFTAVLCPMRLRTGHRGQNLGIRFVHAQEAIISIEHTVPSLAVLVLLGRLGALFTRVRGKSILRSSL